MGIISSEQAKTLLAPFEATLYEAVRRAIERWVRHAAPAFATPTKRTRATAIHDFMLEEVVRFFDARDGFSIVEVAQRKLLRIHPRIAGRPVVLQFKKLSEGAPRNYPTQTALAFDRQTELLGFDDVRLTVGYHLNATGTDPVSIRVLCMNGKRPAWSYELAPAVSGSATVFSFPAAASTKASGGKRRLKPKPGAKGGKVVPIKKPSGGDGDSQ